MPTEILRMLRRLAQKLGRAESDVLFDAVTRYEQARFWDEARRGYERLNADIEDCIAFDAEMALWDTSLLDGPDEFPFEDE